MSFRPGDRVRCPNPFPPFLDDRYHIYTVKCVNYLLHTLELNEICGAWFMHRFEAAHSTIVITDLD